MNHHSRKTLWSGKFLRTIEKKYADPAGNIHTWECYERAGSFGVVIVVPLTNDNQLVLIRQYRPPVEGSVIELPAGLVDEGETPETTARRELQEETGYVADHVSPLISGPYSPALTSGSLDVFLASGVTHVGKTEGDVNEQIETLTIPLDIATDWLLDQIKHGEKVDLKIFGFIYLAQKVRERG